jgi:RNA polymerase-binding transcription factor DksA
MTRSHARQLERDLLAERALLERDVERLTTPPTDAAGERGRFGDDEIASAAGTSGDVDQLLASRASHELDDVDRALIQLQEDPEHFGLCATCARPIPMERLRLVPGTRYCLTHAPQ